MPKRDDIYSDFLAYTGLVDPIPLTDAEWHAFADAIGICPDHPDTTAHCPTCACHSDTAPDAGPYASTDHNCTDT